MKVLFLYVSTNMCRDGDLWFYDEGLASVAACLRRRGHAMALRLVAPGEGVPDVLPWVEAEREERSLLVFITSLLFSAYAHDIPDTFAGVAGLKQATGLPAMFAGLWATLNAESLLAHPGIDWVGRGEMEHALPELCDALEQGRPTGGIANLWCAARGGDPARRNPLRPLVADLAELPFPDRSLVPRAKLANERDGILTVVASRGCPMDCAFCVHHAMRALYDVAPSRYGRTKPVGYLLDEVRAARAADPALWAVFFHDDLFALPPAWAAEFFRRWPQECGLPYGCNLVLGQVRPEFVAALRRSGCRQVQIGIESGDEWLRNEVLGKGISEDEIRRAVALLHEHGIAVKLFALLGVPGETRARLARSLRAFAGYGADMVQVQVWMAHEGTELAASDREAGDAARRQYDPRGHRRAWRLKFYFRWFHRYVALYRVLEAAQAAHPWRARIARALVTASIRCRWAPDLLLGREWDGGLRVPGRVLRLRAVRAAAARVAGRLGRRLWSDARDAETRLAADYLVPDDLPVPEVAGWRDHARIDRRLSCLEEARAAAPA